MQINVDDRGALILGLVGAGIAAAVLAPDATMGVIDAIIGAIAGAAP